MSTESPSSSESPNARPPGPEAASRAYYDEFARVYDARRGGNVPGGYHDLLDELETGFVERFGAGKDVLEVGCGTGLLLERIVRFARSAKGIDLSPGMLERARGRGLDVTEASATKIPFADDSFDVTCSFKVLAHVPDIAGALSEMARVTRPGGVVLAEFYNPTSIRGLLRRLGPAKKISSSKDESDVFTRFDTPARVAEMAPRGCRLETARGIRIVTPAASVADAPVVGRLVTGLERALADGPLKRFAGFYVAAYRKDAR